jgi:putative membrane protein
MVALAPGKSRGKATAVGAWNKLDGPALSLGWAVSHRLVDRNRFEATLQGWRMQRRDEAAPPLTGLGQGRQRPAAWLAAALLLGLVPIAIVLMPSSAPPSAHMAVHILSMNVLAPLAALAFLRTPAHQWLERSLTAATTLQLALLFGSHLPGMMPSVVHGGGTGAIVHGLLLASALWFWLATFSQAGARRWRALAALLVCGKLFCLLGVLLVFAPRPLYLPHVELHVGAGYAEAVADQQLAGLLMVVACPLSYVLAGIIIAARWLGDVADVGRRRVPVIRTA